MEEIILKVIDNRINPYLSSPDKTQKEDCAKALADMNREWTEWSGNQEWDGTRWWLKGMEGMTTDDLFRYWWENIYSKKQSNN